MIKILKYSSIIILFFFTGCLYYSPINEAVSANFTYTGDLIVNKPISLLYTSKDKDLELEWEILTVPEFSDLKVDSFLPSNNINKRVFIPDIPGKYIVSLKVEDEYGAKDSYTKSIVIINNIPTAIIKSLNSGGDFVTNRELHFDASDSYDIDYNQLSSYSWTVVEIPKGSRIVETFSNNIDFSITPDVSGDYRIKLIVSDTNHLKSYTSLSFYVNENLAPKIIETIPDNSSDLISLKKTNIKNFSAVITDDSTLVNGLSYKWEISINSEDYSLFSNNSEVNINANIYGIGDFISLKLTVTDNSENKTTIKWRIIIIE